MRSATAILSPARERAVGLALAALVIAAWLACHVVGVFLVPLPPPAWSLLLIPLQCWLNVGMFIVAHDAMHGSLARDRPGLNRAIGTLCVALYAGFRYGRLREKHFAHHRHSGTSEDPDFHAEAPRGFARWYLSFFLRYFGWTEFATLAALLANYLLVLGVHPANALLFWALPAILSSVQLFYFGTYLPHRHEDQAFGDDHNARSNGYPWPVSLLTCFHFGYHHEHHLAPGVPWWRLPAARAEAFRQAAATGGRTGAAARHRDGEPGGSRAR